MVSKMCECYATVSKSDPRYEMWRKVDPEGRLPLKHPLTKIVVCQQRRMTFYEGDPSRLSEDQKKTIVELMNKKFKVPKHVVAKELAEGVLPIRAANVNVSICNLHVRCMM